ncbi:MAG: hypothetical protein ACRENG_30895 [bacterium]
MEQFELISKLQNKKFALCINAGEYEGVSLFTLKMYECLPDPASEAEGFLRVIDEEGEPYYYDSKAFVKLKSAPNGLLIPFVKPKRTQKKQLLRRGNRQAKRVATS